jgi:hypothetical protein
MGWATFWAIFFTNPSGHPGHSRHSAVFVALEPEPDLVGRLQIGDKLLQKCQRLIQTPVYMLRNFCFGSKFLG